MVGVVAGGQGGDLDVAYALLGDRAPGVEVTTGWGIDRRGDFALEDRPVARAPRVRDRDRRQQGLGATKHRFFSNPISQRLMG